MPMPLFLAFVVFVLPFGETHPHRIIMLVHFGSEAMPILDNTSLICVRMRTWVSISDLSKEEDTRYISSCWINRDFAWIASSLRYWMTPLSSLRLLSISFSVRFISSTVLVIPNVSNSLISRSCE